MSSLLPVIDLCPSVNRRFQPATRSEVGRAKWLVFCPSALASLSPAVQKR
jgi:hypothetical protein